MGERFTEQIVARDRASWNAATVDSEFIRGVRDGSLAPEAFRRWLAQDYHFVDGLFDAQARLLGQAGGPARRVVLGGLVALAEELDWFAEHAERLGISLDDQPAYDNVAYIGYLQSLAFAPASVGLTALWAVERAYLDSWTAARPGAEPYREFVDHWSNDGFRGYVDGLELAADEALACATEPERREAERAASRVIEFELRFWQMAQTSGR